MNFFPRGGGLCVKRQIGKIREKYDFMSNLLCFLSILTFDCFIHIRAGVSCADQDNVRRGLESRGKEKCF